LPEAAVGLTAALLPPYVCGLGSMLRTRVRDGRSAGETAIQAVLDAHGKAWSKDDATAAVAVVDGDSYVSGLHDEKGKELPVETSRYTEVMAKENGRWKVAAFRSLPQLRSTIDPAGVR